MIFDESHPRLKGFNEYFRREIEPALTEMEGARRSALRQGQIAIAVLAVPAAYLLFRAWQMHGDGDWQGWLFGGLACLAAGVGFGYYQISKVKSGFDTHVAGSICRFLELDYTRQCRFSPLARFRELSLIPSYDKSDLEDEISGRIGDIELHLVEARLQDKRTTTDSKGNRKTSYHTVFRGLLAEFTFPKRVKARTIITQDSGKIFNKFKSWGIQGDRVSLEDPEFERIFEVFSSDQVEARYLLTPRFMERLVDLSRHFDRGLQLAFDQDRLYLAGPKRENMFEAGSVFSDLTDTKYVAETLAEIRIILDIIDILNLESTSKV
ncbi:DUF3137 domain-containing protein [Aestuariispira insulae]|uniref:Uncharacterized protein DUF3137 n=1 Tax=Aestuariispira insulae TaxID=1461337 RepID=A0A3D9HAZ1_9PROT|nr:DUF3137 domain-containing protein [Aestuariispira insulae]RED46156.1 uncharacterized protein DUF3137 [Aestuariispira insulae]